MLTRSLNRGFALLLIGLAPWILVNCGGGGTPTSPGEMSYLTGTWSGTLTISRTAQPDVTGVATWTFELVPQTGRQKFESTIRSQNTWLSITTSSTIVLTPTADPPGQIAGTGHYGSPRGCTGDFVTMGSATVNTIDATFDGIDCDDGRGIRLPFSGRIRVTK